MAISDILLLSVIFSFLQFFKNFIILLRAGVCSASTSGCLVETRGVARCSSLVDDGK